MMHPAQDEKPCSVVCFRCVFSLWQLNTLMTGVHSICLWLLQRAFCGGFFVVVFVFFSNPHSVQQMLTKKSCNPEFSKVIELILSVTVNI